MTLGFLNSIENVSAKKKAKTHLKKRDKFSKNTTNSRVVDVEENAITHVTTVIEDLQPNNIHTLLCDIDQRMRSVETYLADMTDKISTPSMSPPVISTSLPIPPPLPLIKSKPAILLTPTNNDINDQIDNTHGGNVLDFLKELKDKVKERKESADLNAVGNDICV